MSTKTKVIVSIVVFLLVVIGYNGLNHYMRNENYQKAIDEIKIPNIEIAQLEDGKYIGEYDADFIKAKVEVHIKDKQITNIEMIEYKHERGERAEKIPQYIIEEQTVDVDIVSGATNSSKVIKKAVANALTNEKQ